MIIDFSRILSTKDKVETFDVELEMDYFELMSTKYRIIEKQPVHLVLSNIGKKQLSIEAVIDVTLDIPCDRCLSDVETRIFVTASKRIDLSDNPADEEAEDDYTVYIEGTDFSVEKFVYGEILVNLPMKVLCDDNCKGICNRCGTNLNHGSCGCDTTELDPRMAKALEVFNSFKEV